MTKLWPIRVGGGPARGGTDRAVAVLCARGALVIAAAQAARGRPRLDVLEVIPLTPDLLATHGSPRGCCRALLPGLVDRHGLRGRRATVVLESARTVARFWAAPALPPKDRLGALGFEAEKWCQTPASELWLGVLDGAATATATGAPAPAGAAVVATVPMVEESFAVASPLDSVGPLLQVVAAAGLEPWGVTVPALALESLLVAGADAAGAGATVAVHVGMERSWLAVCARGRLLMVRELEVARDGLAAALAMIPVEGRGSVRLAPEEAADLLARVGWVADDEPIGMANDRVPLESLKFALRPALERLASSISRSLDFCREQFFIEIPETIALTGEGADVPHLDTYLGANLLAHFARGVAWEGRVELGDAAAERWRAAPELACVAAGAALGALRGRVLAARTTSLGLPRWFALPVRRVLVGAAAAVGLACLVAGVQADRLGARAAAEARRVTTLQTQLDAARADWRARETTRTEQQLVQVFTRGNVRVDGILKILSRAVGADVALTELSLPSINAGLLEVGTTAPSDLPLSTALPQEQDILTLNGVVRIDHERLESALARLIVNLERAPYFEHVTFVRSEETGERTASFELRCRVRQGLRPDGAESVVANR